MRHRIPPELQPPSPAAARRLQRLRHQFGQASTPWNKPDHTWRHPSLGRGDLWSGEGSGYRAWLDSKPRRRGQFYRRPVFALAIWVGLLADVTSIAAFHP